MNRLEKFLNEHERSLSYIEYAEIETEWTEYKSDHESSADNALDFISELPRPYRSYFADEIFAFIGCAEEE